MSEWAAEKNFKLTLSLPAYHCRQWKSWLIYACLVAKGLNKTKSVELIIHRPRTKLKNCNVPPPTDGVTRLTNIKILGVIVTDTLSFDMHIASVISRCSQTSYALRIMRTHGLNGRTHGLNGRALWDVTRATLASKLMYASPVWFGFLNEGSRNRCQAVLNGLKGSEYLGGDFESFVELCGRADEGFLEWLLLTHPMWCINSRTRYSIPPETWYSIPPETSSPLYVATSNK